jgi:hypothetical protein
VGAVKNAMKIDPSKSKALGSTRARVNNTPKYSSVDTLIPEAIGYKFL